MSRTKIVGYLMIVAGAVALAVDVLDGGGVDFAKHIDAIATALAGAGFVFLRDAVAKLK